jgi:hypothetical protein
LITFSNIFQSKAFQLNIKSRRYDDALRNYSPQSRNCYFDGEKPLKFFKSYTMLNCRWECLTNFMLSTCGCVLHSMPRDNQTRICNATEIGCKRTINWAVERCDCYALCNDLSFTVTSEVVKIETNQIEFGK